MAIDSKTTEVSSSYFVTILKNTKTTCHIIHAGVYIIGKDLIEESFLDDESASSWSELVGWRPAPVVKFKRKLNLKVEPEVIDYQV